MGECAVAIAVKIFGVEDRTCGILVIQVDLQNVDFFMPQVLADDYACIAQHHL